MRNVFVIVIFSVALVANHFLGLSNSVVKRAQKIVPVSFSVVPVEESNYRATILLDELDAVLIVRNRVRSQLKFKRAKEGSLFFGTKAVETANGFVVDGDKLAPESKVRIQIGDLDYFAYVKEIHSTE